MIYGRCLINEGMMMMMMMMMLRLLTNCFAKYTWVVAKVMRPLLDISYMPSSSHIHRFLESQLKRDTETLYCEGSVSTVSTEMLLARFVSPRETRWD